MRKKNVTVKPTVDHGIDGTVLGLNIEYNGKKWSEWKTEWRASVMTFMASTTKGSFLSG